MIGADRRLLPTGQSVIEPVAVAEPVEASLAMTSRLVVLAVLAEGETIFAGHRGRLSKAQRPG